MAETHTKRDELEEAFWSALKSDRTIMLGLIGEDGAHTRPMTAQVDAETGNAVWVFSSKETELVQRLGSAAKASFFTFVSSGHDVFAAIEGQMSVRNDTAMIDKLWNPFVAAWYEGGKSDPKLALLKFEPSRGEIWRDGSSLLAGLKLLLGADPKEDYKDNVARVSFK